MSGLSTSYTPAPLAWLESRCLNGTLARKIAVVVFTVLAVATAVLVELDWHHDRSEETRELVQRAEDDAHRLAGRVRASDLTAGSIQALLAPYVAGTSTLERVDLVDPTGRTVWSSHAGSIGVPFDARRLGWSQRSTRGWLANALADGGCGDASERGDRISAVEPIQPGWPQLHRGIVKPGMPVALILIWDERAEADTADARRLYYHGFGFACALTLSFLLWWLLLRVVSRPLAELAAVAGREDLLPSDLALKAERDDEIGALARALTLALHHVEERHAQVEEHMVRLESALNAGHDGLAMASLREDRWVIDHANEVLAAIVGKPAGWFPGRTVHEGLAALRPRLVDPEGIAGWVEQGLSDPEFEGMRVSALVEPDAITELHTRPMRDSHGRASGRIWVVRDVTSAREHERTLTRQNQELAVLDLVGRRVSRSLETRAILHAAVETLAEILDCHGDVQLAEARDEAVPQSAEIVRVSPQRVVVPVSDSAGFVAGLELSRPVGAPFGEDEIALLKRVRYPIETALENARLFRRTEEQLVENQTLCEVSKSIGRADALDDVLSDILRAVCSRLEYRNAAILLPDEAAGHLYVRASEGYHQNLSAIRLPIGGPSVTARCFESGVAINVTDVREFSGYVPGSEDIRSELSLPLKIGERVLGILDLESDRVRRSARRTSACCRRSRTRPRSCCGTPRCSPRPAPARPVSRP